VQLFQTDFYSLADSFAFKLFLSHNHLL